MIALIHIKKTAGKAVKQVMRRQYGPRHCDVKRWEPYREAFDARGLKRLKKLYPGLRSIAGHSLKAYSDMRAEEPRLQYYTLLREPVQRCLSQYQYSIHMGREARGAFEQWIGNPEFRNVQVKALAGREDLDAAIRLCHEQIDFIGLQESLDESLAMLGPALGLSPPGIRQSSSERSAA